MGQPVPTKVGWVVKVEALEEREALEAQQEQEEQQGPEESVAVVPPPHSWRWG
jgi:hypothetical protein